MAKRYDVIVVGAGPAGAMAAKTAGENGLSVALLEMKTKIPGVRRTCTQMLLPMNEDYLGERTSFNGKNGHVCFLRNGLSFNYTGPYQNIYAFEIYSLGGNNLKFGEASVRRKMGDQGRISIATDKGLLIKDLLKQATDNGVEVFPGTTVTDVKKEGDAVKVISDKKTFQGTFVIAADGANSRIVQRLGLNKDRTYYSTMSVIESYMKGLHLPAKGTVYYICAEVNSAPTLCALIPRAYEGEYNVVFITLNPRVDLMKFAHFIMKESKLAHWFKGVDLKVQLSAVGNMYTTILDPFKDNVLLVGDTIWCQESENLGALLSGGKAAIAVKIALLEGKPNREGVATYLDWWKQAFVDRYPRDLIMKNYILGAVMTNEDMDYLFSLMNDVMPASILPYTLPAHLGEAVGKVVSIIQKDRPDILGKLGRMAQEPVEQILAPHSDQSMANR
jgi:digeranylgeranylglycerophospholipid reductase